MKRYPQLRTLSAVARDLRNPQCHAEAVVIRNDSGLKMRGFVPSRGEGFHSLENRIRCAWAVFTGRADAVTWPEDDGIWLEDEEPRNGN